MPNISKWNQVLADNPGKEMIDILIEKYNEYGNQTDVGAALGVSQGTVSLWVKQLGYEERSIIVPRPKPEEARSA